MKIRKEHMDKARLLPFIISPFGQNTIEGKKFNEYAEADCLSDYGKQL